MPEIELKFQVPPVRRAAVQRAVATASARVQPLRAIYFDTPDHRLAAARLSLRLRREGRRWVQTAKGDGSGPHERLEHEVVLPGSTVPSTAVPALHAGTAVGERLRAALRGAEDGLAAVHASRIRRTERIVRAGASRVALALDVGRIEAGDQVLPVHEVEFELKAGRVADLCALALTWVERHALWLDVRSKAERGHRLARPKSQADAQHARPTAVQARMTPEAALRRWVGEALQHALPNAAEIADGRGGPETVHQLRVALRRLRSLLRLYGDASTACDPLWDEQLRSLFGALGQARERDALHEAVLPALHAAGAPLTELPPADESYLPAELLRSPTVNRLLLALLAFAAEPPTAADATTPTLAAWALPVLARLHRRIERDARRFAKLPEAQRHRLRRRLKRLRYGAEFAAALLAPKPLAAYLDALRDAQETLGAYQDLAVAEQLYRDAAAEDARAWFAVGWLVARKDAAARSAARALKRLARAKAPFGS